MIHNSFKERLEALFDESVIKKKGDLAIELNIALSTVSRWFNGSSKPRGHTLRDLANALNTTPQWLLYGKGAKEKNRIRSPYTRDRKKHNIDVPSPFLGIPFKEEMFANLEKAALRDGKTLRAWAHDGLLKLAEQTLQDNYLEQVEYLEQVTASNIEAEPEPKDTEEVPEAEPEPKDAEEAPEAEPEPKDAED